LFSQKDQLKRVKPGGKTQFIINVLCYKDLSGGMLNNLKVKNKVKTCARVISDIQFKWNGLCWLLLFFTFNTSRMADGQCNADV